MATAPLRHQPDYWNESETASKNEEDELNRKAFIPISALLGALLLALVAAMTPFVAERNLAHAQMMDDMTIMYAENGDAPVATFTATDPEGVTSITWSLAPDASH